MFHPNIHDCVFLDDHSKPERSRHLPHPSTYRIKYGPMDHNGELRARVEVKFDEEVMDLIVTGIIEGARRNLAMLHIARQSKALRAERWSRLAAEERANLYRDGGL